MDTTEEARAALAQAILARDEAAAEAETARAAVERIDDQLYEAQRRLEEVRAHAGEKASERIAALVAGGDALVVERDRFAERDAEDAVTACRAARDLCKAAIAEAEKVLMFAQIRVESAAKPILAAEADRLLVEAEALKAKFDDVRAVLLFLSSSLPAGSPLLLRLDNALEAKPARNLPAPAEWRKAHEALMRDAGAPLPGDR
jgi:TATA-binding protein-associated factor Taf7